MWNQLYFTPQTSILVHGLKSKSLFLVTKFSLANGFPHNFSLRSHVASWVNVGTLTYIAIHIQTPLNFIFEFLSNEMHFYSCQQT